MNRRQMILTGAAGLAAAALTRGAGADTKKPPSATSAREALLVATAECRRAGDVCVAHCLSELAQGNTGMAKCSQRVDEMLALVQSTARLVAVDSTLARKQAELCAAACKSCHEACYEHQAHFAQGKHLACKQCGDACERCEAACRAYVAA